MPLPIATALRELLEQIDSLDDVKFSRDIEPYKAEACWETALYQARQALKQEA